MQDIAGLRMMCQFVDDIKKVVELLRKRNDFEIVEERNYISIKKERLSFLSCCDPLSGSNDYMEKRKY